MNNNVPAPLRWISEFVAGDAYARVVFILDEGSDLDGEAYMQCLSSGPLGLVIRNTGANILTYQILGGRTKTAPTAECEVLTAAADVAGGATVVLSYSQINWEYVFVEIQRKTAGQAVTAEVEATQKVV